MAARAEAAARAAATVTVRVEEARVAAARATAAWAAARVAVVRVEEARAAAAARAAAVTTLYNVLSADAPVGAPPEGNAKEVTRRRRRVTTTVSSNDKIMAHGSLPAALSLPAAICSGCARLMPPWCHCAP